MSARKHVIKLLKFYFAMENIQQRIDIATRLAMLRMLDEDNSEGFAYNDTGNLLWFSM